MTHLIGRQLGPYQITALLGEGTLGNMVYRATHLGQRHTVALKVLPALLASEPEVIQRFQLEAQALLELRHPNIVRIYDVGEAQGVAYLAMECLEGGSLAERMQQGRPLPPALVVRWVAHVASALDYAHSRGIIHRDIKPGNVLLDLPKAQDQGERAVLTDFGIARFAGSRLTLRGRIIGTPAYLSPEQAESKPVDRRSDVYSLGVMVYEMLSGRLPFSGEPLALLHSHVHDPPPPIRRFNPSLRKGTEKAIARALAKVPGKRPSTAGGFAQELASSLGVNLASISTAKLGPDAEVSQAQDTLKPIDSIPSRQVGLSGTATRREVQRRPLPVRASFVYAAALLVVVVGALALLLPYIINGSDSTPIPPAETVEPSGVLAFVRNVDPNRDGKLNENERTDICLLELPARSLTCVTQGSEYRSAPAWSPDGSRLAFAWNRNGNTDIYMMDADGSNVQRLTDDTAWDSGPAWDPKSMGLGRIAFDSERPPLDLGPTTGGSQQERYSAIYLLDLRTRQTVRLTDPRERDGDPAWSPDGQFIAFDSHRDEDTAIYVMDAAGTDPRRLSATVLALDMMPTWSPDGQTIAFSRGNPKDEADIYQIGAGGGGEQRVLKGQPAAYYPAWSPDGQWIAFSRRGSTAIDWDLCIMRSDGRNMRCVLDDEYANLYAAWKPNNEVSE